jgi:hypothetical protein
MNWKRLSKKKHKGEGEKITSYIKEKINGALTGYQVL